MVKDERFKRLNTDPVFKKAKRDSSKIVIDERFSAMLESNEFDNIEGPSVDKYGRKKQSSTKSELKRFYKLDRKPRVDAEEVVEEPVDLARGEGGIESSDENESEQEIFEDDAVSVASDTMQGPFGDEDIPLGDETSRLAVVNLDWDHIKARDIFKVVDCFRPKFGNIKKVSIYQSDFGKTRIAQEGIDGPPSEIFKPAITQELSESENDDSDDEPLVQADAGEEFNIQELRKYQLERLRYYYAVVETDSVETAKSIFENCDGAEFESSANFLDLRYVPDATTFEDEPTDVATDIPMAYEASEFVTHALQHSKIKLTWDAEDPERTRVTRRKFTKDDIERMDFKAYLASDDSDDEFGDDMQATGDRYRALLTQNTEEDDNQEMEITFAPGLTERAAKLLAEKDEKEASKSDTVFEQYLRKRKEKRRLRKEGTTEDAEESDLVSSDDMGDPEDPFFQVDFGPEYAKPVVKPEEKEHKSASKKERKLAKDADAKSKAELELLLIGENDHQGKHFSRKDVLKNEKPAKRKNGKKIIKSVGDVQQDFVLDLKDPRFSSVIDSHQMAIDPTNSQFKHTKSMDQILSQRRKIAEEVTVDSASADINLDKIERAKLSQLVASVKRKNELNSKGKGKRQRSAK